MTPLADLARAYGTPAYVYDLQAVRSAHADLRTALPSGTGLYYSVKANPHPLVIACLAGLGCRAEVASPGELDAALAAGVSPDRILVTAPGKSESAVAHALTRRVTHFSADSPTDLARIARQAERLGVPADCLLRVNADRAVPGMGLSMTGTASQFGADASWILREPRLFRGHDTARVTGLHLYMGTNIGEQDKLLRQFSIGVELAAELRASMGEHLTTFDLGGGFGTPFARQGERPVFTSLAAELTSVLDDGLPGWRDGEITVAFESGRYLTGDCGHLLTTVLDTKESKGTRFTVLDTGIHHLGGMSGLRRVPPVSPDVLHADADADADADGGTGVTATGSAPGPVPASGAERPGTPGVLAGPLCTPLDTLSRSVPLPPMETGDVLAVPNVGAYGLSASLVAFLGHDLPVEIVVDAGHVVSATRLHLTRHDAGPDATGPSAHPTHPLEGAPA
ncbi:diaminopimelate decarboxylase [Streptomyces litmocidini]|uniref:type III PLP-dependent enzyme n=1 Tax=Streptomyces litmocidini TaxID=67318 RepID=UPI00167CBD09|nr:type III PLP-dependent enzyme [Streptomyces litmocidini]GGU80629.1 diaminopimelate decarboxylase [Streptomyces litmocidini]